MPHRGENAKRKFAKLREYALRAQQLFPINTMDELRAGSFAEAKGIVARDWDFHIRNGLCGCRVCFNRSEPCTLASAPGSLRCINCANGNHEGLSDTLV